MLILDLDNTIFPTNSMDPKVFAPAIGVVEAYLSTRFAKEELEEMINELWAVPYDSVSKKYGFPEEVNSNFYKVIQELDYDLKIETYSDYPFLRKLPHRKILVTTGFEKLQQAKISALGIRDDFEAVYIDDSSALNRIGKKGIFENVLKQEKLTSKDVWVIGDNPNSEIAAAKSLGIKTIQMLRPEANFSPSADFSFNSFEELDSVL